MFPIHGPPRARVTRLSQNLGVQIGSGNWFPLARTICNGTDSCCTCTLKDNAKHMAQVVNVVALVLSDFFGCFALFQEQEA